MKHNRNFRIAVLGVVIFGVFSAFLTTIDLTYQVRGILPLANGGMNADLSGTGGTSQVLKQTSAGAAVTVAQVAFTDLSGSASVAQIPNLPASIITSGQLTLARGGTNADLSGTGGTAFVLRQSSVGAAITAAQLAFSEISGSVAASQLPNPTASTLGGIESYAAVSNQWINTISTSGVPSSTQPAFSNISSTLAGSQMPTTFETSGIGYFIAFFGMTGIPGGGTSGALGTQRFVYATQVLYPITVRKTSFDCTAAVAASKVYTALYDSTGTLVANSSNGGVATTSTGLKQTTLGTPFTINPGLYYVFIQGDTAGIGVDVSSGGGLSAAAVLIMNGSFVRMGVPANAVSAGSVPPTLGSITGSISVVTTVMFES